MSFYFDDYDDDHIVASQGGQSTNNTFHCPDCGSGESYTDETGHLFCALCHAQSQTQQNEGEMDFAEMALHGAKSRKGQFVRVNTKKKSKKRRPYEDFDRSRNLPTLDECLQGYTTVIFVCLKEMQRILSLDDSRYEALKDNVRTIWLAYLQSWEEGASFYRKYHPEVRIALRDNFMNHVTVKRILNRYLFSKAIKKVKSERKASSWGRIIKPEDCDSAIDILVTTKTKSAPATLAGMLDLYKRKTHKEAALRVKLDMSTIASLILAAAWKLGIGAHDIARWISSGEIPLLNAYKICLSTEQQNELTLVESAYRMANLPSSSDIEYTAKLIMIAARLEPVLVTPKSAPLMAERLIQGMQLPAEALENTLGLLAQKLTDKADNKKRIQTRKKFWAIRETSNVLAAIVVGYRMCEGWEHSVYYKDVINTIPWNEEHIPYVKSLESYLEFVQSNILDGHPGNRMGKNPVPDFLNVEEAATTKSRDVGTILDDIATKIADSAAQNSDDDSSEGVNQRMSWDEPQHGQSNVSFETKTNTRQMGVKPSSCPNNSPLPKVIIAGIRNNPKHLRRATTTRLSKYHEWKLRVKDPKAIWADANGIGKYVYYPIDSIFEETHPHYQLLLEFMSYISDVSPHAIHDSVCRLDFKLFHTDFFENQVGKAHYMMYGRTTNHPKKQSNINNRKQQVVVTDCSNAENKQDEPDLSLAELARRARWHARMRKAQDKAKKRREKAAKRKRQNEGSDDYFPKRRRARGEEVAQQDDMAGMRRMEEESVAGSYPTIAQIPPSDPSLTTKHIHANETTTDIDASQNNDIHHLMRSVSQIEEV